MKNLFLLSLFTIFFSCQYQTEIKRKTAVVKDSVVQKEVKVDTITVKDFDTIEKKKASEKIESKEGDVVLLPNNLYAVIILDYYSKYNKEDSVTTWISVPKKVKVFDRKTKKRVKERRFDDYYSSDDGGLIYGDFNFDKKMDVAIKGEPLLSHTIYDHWDFYLSTQNGYKFSKSFSAIMDYPVSIFDLDAKSKTISVCDGPLPNIERLYKIKNNQAQLVKMTTDDYYGPFQLIKYFNEKGRVYKKDKLIKDYLKVSDYKHSVLSFEVKNSKNNINIFIDDDSNKLYYIQIERKDSLVSFDYSAEFNYNFKNNSLVFKDQKTLYKVYDSKNDVGVEITRNGKTTKLVGDNKAKHGSLYRLINLKELNKKNGYNDNIVIEK